MEELGWIARQKDCAIPSVFPADGSRICGALAGDPVPMFRSVALSLCASLGLSVHLGAKAPTIRIEVKGAALTSPIEITSREALNEYTFFDGPGVSTMSGGYAPGSIIDWKSGFVAQLPARRQHYELLFYWPPRARPQARCFTEKPCLVYSAFYDYDPSSKRGFVYLPGQGEPWHDLDINVVYHGVEGHWFNATDSWNGFLRLLLSNRSDRSRQTASIAPPKVAVIGKSRAAAEWPEHFSANAVRSQAMSWQARPMRSRSNSAYH